MLTEVRHIRIGYDDWEDINSLHVSITDLIGGEMQEVYRVKSNGTGDAEVIAPWLNLGYTGEN